MGSSSQIANSFLTQFICRHRIRKASMINFPDGNKFAFTIFDDTDYATIEKIKPIYDLLAELKIITTKSVWVFPSQNRKNQYYSSQTLSDPEYLFFIKQLQKSGFEIAFHNASMESSDRKNTLLALTNFKQWLGNYPNIHVNHHENKENLYWGIERLNFPLYRFLMYVATRKRKNYYQGHCSDSRYFWGDACLKHITYVRGFTFQQINLLRINPTLPYNDLRRPFASFWFSASDAGNVEKFISLLRFENQEKLERERGVCILYTHFGNKGFVENGKINTRVRELLTILSKRKGWFVPVTTLLDYLRSQQSHSIIPRHERLRMETIWCLSKIFYGSS